MAPADDLKFLVGKLEKMKDLGDILEVEKELQLYREAVEGDTGARDTDLDYKSLRQLGRINERADELLEEIWCWHERLRNSGSFTCFFNKMNFRSAIAKQLKDLTNDYRTRMELPEAPDRMTKYLFSQDRMRSDLFWEPLDIYNSLSLKYELLPIYLRNCFQFCSLFPADHNYDMEELGEIWLAERFRKNESEVDHPELAHYAELWKDWFFPYSECSAGKAIYKMPYLMHQLSDRESTDSFKMMRMHTMEDSKVVQPLNDHRKSWHLSLLVDSEISTFPEVLPSSKKLKTLILLRETEMVLLNHKCKISRIPPLLLASMKHLCVLDLQYTMIEKLPRMLGNLLNLRYLNLSGTHIRTVPRWIRKLQSLMFLKLVNCKYLRKLNDAVARLVNLQKLDIAGCVCLDHVPNRIDNMKQLRCMNIKDCSLLNQMPYSLGQLTTLHTLPRYIVGENDGYTISELQSLTGLEGELRVENLQKVARGTDAATAELDKKTKIKSLTLKWNWKHAEEEKAIEPTEEEIKLEKLQPHSNLIKLEIISYMGKQIPSWMSGMDSLKEIKLFNLKGCQKLPPLGVLPHLRVAEISGMDEITMVDEEFYGFNGTFPSLQKLIFSQMLKLKKWSDVKRENMFPCLTNLTIISCPELVELEMKLPSVTELIMWLNNDGLYGSEGDLKGLTGSLKKLSISLCEKLLDSSECKGLQELRALEELKISGCQELTSLPSGIRHLNHIKSLTIICCNKLVPLSNWPNWFKNEFTSLCSLSINGCNSLAEHSTGTK